VEINNKQKNKSKINNLKAAKDLDVIWECVEGTPPFIALMRIVSWIL